MEDRSPNPNLRLGEVGSGPPAHSQHQVLQVNIVTHNAPNTNDDDQTNSFGLFSGEFLLHHGLYLIDMNTYWSLLGIAFYPQNLFYKDIFIAIHYNPKDRTMSALEEVHRIAHADPRRPLRQSVGVLVHGGADRPCQKFWLLLGGFFFLVVFMLGLVIPCHHWTMLGDHIGFVMLHAPTFFANLGPKCASFIVLSANWLSFMSLGHRVEVTRGSIDHAPVVALFDKT